MIEKLKQVVKKHRKHNKPVWKMIANEMNLEFDYKSPEGWRKYYNRHKDKNLEEEKEKMKLKSLKAKAKEEEKKEKERIKKLKVEANAKINGFVPPKNYKFKIDKEFKFMVISDSHLGSVYEQLTYLHSLYDLAAERGITTIYHCGDISEGYKQSRPDHVYSLHKIGFDDQANYIIRNYPHREGITTYFITGNHDHFHIQNGGANIGERIGSMRKDMIYLGINNARIELTHNCRMDLFHPQDGSSYALSYAGQKFLDSLSGGDKPNIIFVGHHHKGIFFIYRNVYYFEVPSTCLQSDWEKGKRIQNTSGAWLVNLKIDEEGTIVSLVSEFLQHFKKDYEDYKNWK